MKVLRPSHWSTLAVAVTAINSIVALAIGSWLLSGGLLALLVLLWLARREERNRPIAEVHAGEVRLRGGALAADLRVESIQGFRREGKSLYVSLDGGGEIRVGPYWSEGPAAEIEKLLERAIEPSDPALG